MKVRLTLAAAVLLVNLFAVPSVFAADASLKAEVEALRAEVATLKAEVEKMRAQQPAPRVVPAPIPTAPQTIAASQPASLPPPLPEPSKTSLWGYGQLDYKRPTGNAADARADLTRAVIGFNHQFDEVTRVYAELEWEHAVASADDEGEVEVEQLYVEHALGQNYGVRAGLMLVPLGILNEHHEPTHFYGVERNYVETAIIPSTWREGGVAAYGATDSGFNWNVGITTGPDLGKWDPASPEGRESPLGAIHQELQLAHAHDPSVFAAANWQGIPGLEIGAGIFTGKIGQATSKQTQADGGETATFPADNARLFLGEVHARWQPGPFDFSALYARGRISDTQALNRTFFGQPTPVPKSFWGSYVQGAWRALSWNQSSLAPFLRYEAFNTAASYAAQAQGFGASTLPTQRVWTVGANYYLNPNVVFKIDYRNFRRDDALLGYGDRIDLGIGYEF